MLWELLCGLCLSADFWGLCAVCHFFNLYAEIFFQSDLQKWVPFFVVVILFSVSEDFPYSAFLIPPWGNLLICLLILIYLLCVNVQVSFISWSGNLSSYGFEMLCFYINLRYEWTITYCPENVSFHFVGDLVTMSFNMQNSKILM